MKDTRIQLRGFKCIVEVGRGGGRPSHRPGAAAGLGYGSACDVYPRDVVWMVCTGGYGGCARVLSVFISLRPKFNHNCFQVFFSFLAPCFF